MKRDATKKFSLMRYRSIFGQSNLFFTNEVYIVANSHTKFEELLNSSQTTTFLLRFSSTFNNSIYIKAPLFCPCYKFARTKV